MADLAPKVDRQTTTPFLLRLFYKQGSFHRLDEFSPDARLPSQHLQIYTWTSCTLSELSSLLLTALPTLLPSPYAGTRIAFRMIFADLQNSRPGTPGRYISRELGSVVVGASNSSKAEEENGFDVKEALGNLGGEPDKMLSDAKFVIGDYIACAILPPLPDGRVASAPPPPSVPGARGPMGGGRGANGYAGRGGRDDYGYGGRGGRDDYGGYGRGGRGGSRYEDRRGFEDRRGSGGLPPGEWRRGEAPPPPSGGDSYWRGGGGGGRGRGRGRW